MSLFGRRKTVDSTAPEEDFLLTRPAPGESVFRGANIIEDVAILRWETSYGGVGLAYSLTDGSHPETVVKTLRNEYEDGLPNLYAAIVAPQFYLGFGGPELKALDIYKGGQVSAVYEPTWQQVATNVGTAVPFWQSRLRYPETILAWQPGAPPAIVPAVDNEMPTEPFTTLAIDEPDDSPVAQLCLWLARTIRHGAMSGCQDYINDAVEMSRAGQYWTLGAIPLEIKREEPEPPPDVIRRDGWAQILERRDILAAKVATLGDMWDGGADWPAAATAQVRPARCSMARTWEERLVPAEKPPRVLELHLLDSLDFPDQVGELLQDPKTGLPAVYWNEGEEDEYIATKVPQRLPATAPLAYVTLCDRTVWIGTEDGEVWIAPQRPDNGLAWGYSGGGPYTLAQLLDRLLGDIVAPAIYIGADKPLPGLLRLIKNTPKQGSTTYTREQLERARNEPPQPNEDEWLDIND